MRPVISAIEFSLPPNDQFTKGLTNVRMKRLGGLVILAGANGSGKSRLLELVATHSSGGFSMPPPAHPIRTAFTGDVVGTTQFYRVPPIQGSVMHSTLTQTQQDADSAKHQFLTDAINFDANINLAARMISRLAQDYIDTGNNLLQMSKVEIDARVRRWEAARAMLDALLGIRIDYSSERHVLINQTPIDLAYQQFSDGEKKLFALSVNLLGQTLVRKPQVIVFDEPENSLHPDAAISLLRQMQKVLDNGQLWIATHSVPLLAGLGMESVWYAQNGVISFGGNQTQNVINGLIGGRDNLFALREVIAEPDRIAMAQFSAECLLSPQPVVGVRTDDPQSQQIDSAMSESSTMRVLDWGCGNGRLKIWLALHSQKEKVEYVGYERDAEQAGVCRDRIARVIGGEVDFIHSSLSALHEVVKSAGLFDYVVIANVLHEIPAVDWQDQFIEISKLLKADGRLLLLEDSLLPHGELPHLSGFLMVDKTSCEALFGISAGDIFSIHPTDQNYFGRLLALSIPGHSLSSVTLEKVLDCVNGIRERALLTVKSYRVAQLTSHRGVDQLAGHKHAVAVMQFANAELAIESLKAKLDKLDQARAKAEL